MERYYDAHLYVANWGTHRVMVRLPCGLLDPDVVDDYCAGEQTDAWVAGEFVVLDFSSEDDAGEFEFDDDAEALLSEIVGVRAELAARDLRPLYLAWLVAYGAWERDENVFDRDADDDLEPPIPAGLGALTAPQRALADFLRLDDDLLAIAAQVSPPATRAPSRPVTSQRGWRACRLPRRTGCWRESCRVRRRECTWSCGDGSAATAPRPSPLPPAGAWPTYSMPPPAAGRTLSATLPPSTSAARLAVSGFGARRRTTTPRAARRVNAANRSVVTSRERSPRRCGPPLPAPPGPVALARRPPNPGTKIG